MLVRDVGEFQLIDTLAEVIAAESSTPIERLTEQGFRLRLSIGDDAAAWDGPAGTRVLTTDTMVEGVHFRLDYTGWRDLGWKSMAANLSDVAVMGCLPSYAVITLGLREDLPVEGLVEMYRGMLEACRRCGGAIVGGDVVRSPVFFVTVALEGTTPASSHGKLLTRDAASPGDRIAVTGSLGCSAAGLRMLTEAGTAPGGCLFDRETANHLAGAHNRPLPRVAEGMVLAAEGVAAAIDISDGLVDDLGKLCKASGVGAVIRSNSVPIDEFLVGAYPKESLDLALGGGEDYELLFTAPQPVMDRVEAMLEVSVSTIGEIVEGPSQVTVLDQDGGAMSVERGGWDHFSSR